MIFLWIACYMLLSSTFVVIWWIDKFWKKICCISMWQSTLLNKCKEDTHSHFFYSLRKQPKFPDWLKFASTNQHEQPRSGWCRVVSMSFLHTFLRRHFAGIASRNVSCYRRLYLSRFPVVVIVFLLSFLFALLADVTFAFLCFYRNRQRTQTHWPRLSWICWLISLVGQIRKQKVS